MSPCNAVSLKRSTAECSPAVLPNVISDLFKVITCFVSVAWASKRPQTGVSSEDGPGSVEGSSSMTVAAVASFGGTLIFRCRYRMKLTVSMASNYHWDFQRGGNDIFGGGFTQD